MITFRSPELEESRIAELRDFVTVATCGDENEWERAMDTVAMWAIDLTPWNGRVSRSTLRYCWELYVALLSSEVQA